MGAWESPLMPGESEARSRGSGLGLLLIADPMGHDTGGHVLGCGKGWNAKVARCTDEPIAKLGLQVAGPDPNQQAGLFPLPISPTSLLFIHVSAQQLEPLLPALL